MSLLARMQQAGDEENGQAEPGAGARTTLEKHREERTRHVRRRIQDMLLAEMRAQQADEIRQRKKEEQTKKKSKGEDQPETHAVKSKLQRVQLGKRSTTLESAQHAGTRRRIAELLDQVLKEEGLLLGRAEHKRVYEQLVFDLLGYGPLEPLLADSDITDIMVIGPGRVYIERLGRLERTAIRFDDEEHLRHIIDRILGPLGRRIDEMSPMVDARLPDGSRVNVVIPPLALDGTYLTIRKFSEVPLGITDLIEMKTATVEVFEFLQAAVAAKLNILVSGGSGSGKTTLLNVISAGIPDDSRVVTIENAAELQLRQRHVIRLETRPPSIEGTGEILIRDLMINALRMGPDRLIVGEVRGGEAVDLLQAMNTGIEGSMSSIHANSPYDALARLETMGLTAGLKLPPRAIREQIASAIDLIVQMERMRDGTRRIVAISELEGIIGDNLSVVELFTWEQLSVTPQGEINGVLRPTGIAPRALDRMHDMGIYLPLAMFGLAGASPPPRRPLKEYRDAPEAQDAEDTLYGRSDGEQMSESGEPESQQPTRPEDMGPMA